MPPLKMNYLGCVVVVLLAMAVTGTQPQRQIRYALFISGPDGELDVSGVVPATELAEERVHLNTSILSEYEFGHSSVVDTLCDRTRSLNLFFETVAEADPPMLGLVGGGCSVASEPIAEIIHHWNISQVAYDSSSILLSDRRRFVNFFRTYPSDITFGPDVLSFLRFYGWNRIMFVTEQEELFTGIYDNLSQLLMQKNITTRNRMVTRSMASIQRNNFFFPEDDIRVIFINTYSNVARILLCEAIRTHNLAGLPKYVWITYAWYQDRWWTSAVNDDPIRCDESEIVQLLRRSLAIEVVPVSDDPDQATDVGLTTNEFNEEYLRRLDTPAARENNSTFTFVAPIAYDAVWSLALALNKTDAMLAWPKERVIQATYCQDDGIDLSGFRLDNFTYDHTFVGCVVRWNLERTNFIGVSGRVSFDSNGTREQGEVIVLQYRDSTSSSASTGIELVRISQINDSVYTYDENQSNDTVFPDGIPSDGTPLEVIVTFHLALVIIYYVLTFLGFVFATVCLIFNFVYRNRKVVRLTSPNLNYLIILGSFIMYTAIAIRLIPSIDETVNYIICNLQLFLTTLAYCLAFGTILVKVGRVYHIFNNPTEKKKTLLKDWHMALIVLTITGVGVLLAILGWAIPQLRATPTLQPDSERPLGRDEFGVRIEYMVWQCSVDRLADLVAIIIFAYLGLLQVVGIILAIQTRKVKVKVLNDSKYIAALIYISSIVLIVIVIINFTVGGYINVAEVFYSGGLLLATTAFLGLTFIPKMVSLYKDPLGENIFSKNSSTIEVSRSGALSLKKRGDKVLELEARVKELEGLLRESVVPGSEGLEVSGVSSCKLMADTTNDNIKESRGDDVTEQLELNNGHALQEDDHRVSSTYSVTSV